MSSLRPFNVWPLLVVLALAACGAPGTQPGPAAATVVLPPPVTDGAGRVVRARADRNMDDSVGRAIASQLKSTDATAYRGVSVLAWDGTVLLTGAVAKPGERRHAEQLAQSMPEVRMVFDELTLVEDPAAIAFVPDAAREQRIYAGLLGEDAITGAYTVRMVNGIAYLLGTTRSSEDSARAVAFVSAADGVKWVVDHAQVR